MKTICDIYGWYRISWLESSDKFSLTATKKEVGP